MAPAESQGFMDRIHAHKHARLLEFLLWGIPGLVLVVVSYLSVTLDWTGSDAPGLIGLVIGLALMGWGLIPPKAPPQEPARNPKSKRR